MTETKLSVPACAMYLSMLAVGCGGGSSAANTAPDHPGSAGSDANGPGGSAGTGTLGSAGSGNVATGGSDPTGGNSSSGAGTSGSSGSVNDGGSAGETSGANSGGASSAGSNSGGSSGSAGQGGSPSTGPALAFPGAQGFGKNATGGRAGSVYHVTNLNDSGAGSFRDAVGTSNRIVVFDVGGYVQLKTAVSAKSNLTIAGQTAPGGGIGFRGGEVSFANQTNVILRFVRIRPGSETASTEDDALSLYRAANIVIDHCSLEFAPWNNIDGVSDDYQNHPATNITFSDSLIADPTGQQFGAHTESVNSNWAWFRNIFANSHNRNPLAKVNTVFVNNLLYNYSAGYTTHTSTNFEHDILNNYFVFGPASTGTDNTWFQVDKNQAIYSAGNLKDINRNGSLDGAGTTPYWYQGTGTVLTKPWSTETNATPALDAPSAARVAMSQAGPLPRDELDKLVVSQILTLGNGPTGTGANTVGPGSDLYTSQTQTGLANNGYGSIAAGTRVADTDNDGMPDNWEQATGSDPKSDDAMKKATDGYALIEHYLNWLALPHAITSAGMAVDLDLAAYTAGFAGVSPAFTVNGAANGTVTLGADKHSAHFTPTAGFKGIASFSFTVKGSDGTSYTSAASVLVTPESP